MDAPDSQPKSIAELQKQIAQANEQRDAAQRELDALLYAVSHDLRAPLRSVSGFSQVLADSLDAKDEKTRHYIERIHQASRKLSEYIDALLTLSRIAQADLHPRDIDFAQLCREALQTIQSKYAGRTIQLEVAPHLHAFGDQRLLRTALEMLLDNAAKFSSRCDIIQIEIGRTHEGAYFVKDHGAGFDMKYAEKLGRPFQRLHADSDFPGLGAGLAVVQRIVGRHLGRIWFDSAPNRGTTAFFTLGPTSLEGKSAPAST